MKREYHKWYSHSLKKEMELLVFGYAGAKVLFFPPRMGRFYDYENWKIIRNRYSADLSNTKGNKLAKDSDFTTLPVSPIK